jgi:hypothetical protein
MENYITFDKWLEETIKAGQEKLEVKDSTLAYILMQKGLNYYLKSICRQNLKETIK